MKTPTVTAIAIGCAALGLSVLAATPAQASHYSLDTMSANMMSATQARTLGVASDHVRTFGYGSGVNEIPDVIWLCDVAGDKEIEVDGSPELYGVAFSSEKSRTVTIAGQELHAFNTEADARKAMKAIRKAATKCSGTFKVKDDQGWTITQKVSNGQGKTTDGNGFVWIKEVATDADAQTGLAESEYNTFRRVGEFIQVVSIEAAGPNATKITSTQIKATDQLTGTLGSYWAW